VENHIIIRLILFQFAKVKLDRTNNEITYPRKKVRPGKVLFPNQETCDPQGLHNDKKISISSTGTGNLG